jgi:predicted amidohydrolase
MAIRVACIQVTAGVDMAANVAAATAAIAEAAGRGAGFVTTPENVTMMAASGKETRANARVEADHPGLGAFRDAARNHGVWLLAGSLGIALPSGKVANRSFLIDPSGDVAGRYDKIHMFDVELPNGEVYRESANFEPGTEAVTVATPFGVIGLTVCYDIRFPHLYRALAKADAGIITVPSAFTAVTGAAHWHVLLRARAIETGAFIVAPAQTGNHPGGRKTYGHSLVVAPWGEVLLDGGEAVGVHVVDLDLGRVANARQSVPSLRHDRPFALGPSSSPVQGAA